MFDARPPWKISPQLTEGRLWLVASTFDRVRAEVVETHEPEKGDGAWGFGCRAYERTCFALCKLAEKPANRSWLVVEVDKLACTLRIDGVPIKFYRGDSDDPKASALRGGAAASAAIRDAKSGQQRLSFTEEEQDDAAWFWLLAIDAHSEGGVIRVTALQATEAGSMRNSWDIPLHEPVAAMADVAQLRREGVDLPPPSVSPAAQHKETETVPSAAGSADGKQ